MAVILVLDRANVRGKKRPRVRKVVADGYVLYAEKENSKGVAISAQGGGSIHALGLARQLVDMGIGEQTRDALLEAIAHKAAEEIAQAQRKKWQAIEAGEKRND